MNLFKTFLIALLVVVCFYRQQCWATNTKPQYVAYSLRQATHHAINNECEEGLHNLGGIRRILAMVYDRELKDVIIIGLVAEELPEATLDDLVVALRARLRYNEFPLVSIDPVEDTERTSLQHVRFDGHLNNTQFGKDFLDCDVILKRYSLQTINNLETVPSYIMRIEDDLHIRLHSQGIDTIAVNWMDKEQGVNVEKGYHGSTISNSGNYIARFWFYVNQPYNASCKPDKNNPEIFCINSLKISLQSEDTLTGVIPVQDRLSKIYCKDWTTSFNEISEIYPKLKRLKQIFDLTAVADAIGHLEEQPYLSYFLEEFPIHEVFTEPTWDLEVRYAQVQRSDQKIHLVRVSGGIEFRTELKFLNFGDIAPLRDIVVKSRPSDNTLFWYLPLQEWNMPNSDGLKTPNENLNKTPRRSDTGCSTICQSVILNPNPSVEGTSFPGFSMPTNPMPPLKGISMEMKVDNRSFSIDESGNLNDLKKEYFNSRESRESLIWSTKESEENQ